MSEKSKPTVNIYLQQERLLRGWSQQELADLLATTSVTVSRWERGIQYPSPIMRLRLCAIFGKTAQELGLLADVSEDVPLTQHGHQEDPIQDTLADEEPREIRHEEPTLIPQHATEPYPTPLLNPVFSVPVVHATHKNKVWYFWSRTWVGRGAASFLFLLLGGVVLFGIDSVPLPTHSTHPQTNVLPHASTPAKQTTLLSLGYLSTISPVINDSLAGQPTQGQWVTGNHCSFQNHGYEVDTWDTIYCGANARAFQDFAYQVEVSLLQGARAGIDFRADADSHMYIFWIDALGYYGLQRSNPPDPQEPETLLQGFSPALHKGYNHFNTLSAIVLGSTIRLFLNGHMVGQTQDTTFPAGYVGVLVEAPVTGPGLEGVFSRAHFQHAKIWDLSDS